MMSIYSGVCQIYTPHHSVHLRYPCISIQPPSLLEDVLGGDDQASLEIHLETERWSEHRDALACCDWASMEMHLEAKIEWTQRCTWKPWLSRFGDVLGGRDRVNSEMHLEAIIERGQRFTWSPWSINIGGVLGGGWSAGDWSKGGQSRVSESRGGRLGGMCDWGWDYIYWLTRNCGNGESWVQHVPLRDWLGAGDSRSWEYAARGVCCPRWMLYMVYAVLAVCCTQCMLYSVLPLDHGMKRWREMTSLRDLRWR